MKSAVPLVLFLAATRVAAGNGEVTQACTEMLKVDFHFAPVPPAPTPAPKPVRGVVQMKPVVVLAPNLARQLDEKLQEQDQKRADATEIDRWNLRAAGIQIGQTQIELGIWWNPVDEHRGILRTRNLGIKADLLRIRW